MGGMENMGGAGGRMGMRGMSCGMCGGMMGMGACSMMQGSPMMVMPYLEYLDLSEEQRGEIDALMTGMEERISEAREEAGMANPARAFLDLFSESDFSAASLDDFNERAAALAEEIRQIHEATLVGIHGVLTADQLEQLETIDVDDADGGMRRGCGSGGMNGMGRNGGGCRGMR